VTLSAYLPILLLIIISTIFAVASIFVSSKLAPSRWTLAKRLPYECGIVPEQSDERERFPVKFYLVAMLFILFDLEIVFMYPWAVVYRDFVVGSPGLIFGSMFSFVSILTVGYVYAIKKGALDWTR
jgi:NADH-quinone oxidoreductase subunit A